MNSALRWGLASVMSVMSVMSVAAGTAGAQDGGPPAAVTPNPRAVERFKEAGRDAPLTVLPTHMAGRSIPQVGEVIALMLERCGMTSLETSVAAFSPPPGADQAATAAALGEFIRANPQPTEYVLFTEFMLSRETGVSEVRGVVVGIQGEIVWQDRQVKGDPDFDRLKPGEPMECCQLIVERLRPALGLGEMRDENAPPGKLEQRWRKSTGLPDKAELAAIEERGAAFRKAAADATMVVYPAHAGDAFSPESAINLAALINDKALMRATASKDGPRLEIARNPNEQKVLWSMANAFSEYIRKNPPDADYALFADYLMGKDAVGGVHFAICNRQGELVVVDFQNSHWPDFRSVNPSSREDCDMLVLKRLEDYCR